MLEKDPVLVVYLAATKAIWECTECAAESYIKHIFAFTEISYISDSVN